MRVSFEKIMFLCKPGKAHNPAGLSPPGEQQNHALDRIGILECTIPSSAIL
jgi:hypothetical protein